MSQQGQCFVLLLPHQFGLVVGLVLVPAKVERAVDQYSQELIIEGFPKLVGILPYPVQTYQNAAGHHIADTLVKGDDVGISVVIQKADIALKHIVVITENIGDVAWHLPFLANHPLQPNFMFQRRFERTCRNIFKRNHSEWEMVITFV